MRRARPHHIQIASALAILLASSACVATSRQRSSPATVAPTGRVPALEPEYTPFNLPDPRRPWTMEDYVRARDGLVRIDVESPMLLPRREGPGAGLFARVSSLNEVRTALEQERDIERFLTISDVLGDISRLYVFRVAKGEPLGPEYLAMSAVFLSTSARTVPNVLKATKLDARGLKAEPIRMDGLLKARYWLAFTFTIILDSPTQTQGRVGALETARELVPVVEEVAPLLLDTEREKAREEVEKLAAAGAAPADIASLRSAFAPGSPALPIVIELEPEHRTYAEQQTEIQRRAIAGLIKPVQVGPAGEWTRYAFPGAGFSAVFKQQPGASLQKIAAQDGAQITVRILTHKSSTGFSMMASCMTRPAVPGVEHDFAKGMVAKQKPATAREIKVGNFWGMEGTFDGGDTRGMFRVINVGILGCLIMAEYPTNLPDVIGNDDRHFIESFDPGSYTGE